MQDIINLITDSTIYNIFTILSTLLWIIYPCREWIKEYYQSKVEKESIKLKLEKHPKKTILIVEKHTPLPGQITDYGIKLHNQRKLFSLAHADSLTAPTTFTDSKRIGIGHEYLDRLGISKDAISYFYVKISSKKYEIACNDP